MSRFAAFVQNPASFDMFYNAHFFTGITAIVTRTDFAVFKCFSNFGSDLGCSSANDEETPPNVTAAQKKRPPKKAAPQNMRWIWIGVERNHTVLLLYVYVFILSISVFILIGRVLKMHGIANLRQPLDGAVQILLLAEAQSQDARNVFPALDDLNIA